MGYKYRLFYCFRLTCRIPAFAFLVLSTNIIPIGVNVMCCHESWRWLVDISCGPNSIFRKTHECTPASWYGLTFSSFSNKKLVISQVTVNSAPLFTQGFFFQVSSALLDKRVIRAHLTENLSLVQSVLINKKLIKTYQAEDLSGLFKQDLSGFISKRSLKLSRRTYQGSSSKKLIKCHQGKSLSRPIKRGLIWIHQPKSLSAPINKCPPTHQANKSAWFDTAEHSKEAQLPILSFSAFSIITLQTLQQLPGLLY